MNNYYPKMEQQHKAEQTPSDVMYPSLQTKAPSSERYPSLSQRKSSPESTRIDDQAKGGPSDTPPVGSQEDDGASVAADDSGAVLPSDQWRGELAKGNYDGVGKAVLGELKSLGASEAEISTAQTLCNLASEKRNDPEWTRWSLEMLDWVRGLRG